MGEHEGKADDKFGAIIKRERQKRELSLNKLEELTEQAGNKITASYINRLESGDKNKPSFDVVCTLATALSLDLREILRVFGFGHLLKNDLQSSSDTFADLIRLNNISAPTPILDGYEAVEKEYLSQTEKEQLIEVIECAYQFSVDDSKSVVYQLPNIMEKLVKFREIRQERPRKLKVKGR